MDWPLAIERNRQALLAIVAIIVDLLGGRDGAGVIARGLRSAALALLRPAEAAARRLIVIAARGLTIPPGAPRPALPAGLQSSGSGDGRPPAFRLFDRPKRYSPAARVAPRGVPPIRTFWGPPPSPPPPPAPSAVRPDIEAMVDGAGLRLRLASLEYALADLPRQARRLARRTSQVRSRPMRAPLRFGPPPGYRRTPGREIDLVLRECHALALDARRPDTS